VQSDGPRSTHTSRRPPKNAAPRSRLLRDLCREELRGFEEAMRNGMPGYLRDGVVEIGFASQKATISF